MVVPAGDWPPGTVLNKTLLENNDPCHYEADGGVSNKKFQRYFRERDWRTFMICDPSGARNLADADLDRRAA
jgi:hypothetical protein